MKKQLWLSSVCVCAMWAAAPQGIAMDVSPEAKAVVEASNGFAFDFYHKAASRAGNLCYSPASIHVALGMAYTGAAGATQDQMAKALNYPVGGDKLAASYSELLKAWQTPGLTPKEEPTYTLSLANGLWPAQHFTCQASFTELIKKQYGASFQALDYAKSTEASRDIINQSIAKQTQGKIPELLPKGVLTASTRLVLTNAVHFQSQWARPFHKRMTKKGNFQVSASQQVPCVLMRQEGQFRYFEDGDVQVLELPFMMEELSMVFCLPKQTEGLSAVEQKLSAKVVQDWASQTKREYVAMTIPRFRIDSRLPLPALLTPLGMVDAFTPAANFTGIAAESMHISDALHQSVLAVDEMGAEAASATGVIFDKTGPAPKPKEFKTFNANHPFVFMIRHNATKSVLFVGRLAAPEAGRWGR